MARSAERIKVLAASVAGPALPTARARRASATRTDGRDGGRAARIPWREPTAWTVLLLALLAAVLAGRAPITRAIGTAAPVKPAVGVAAAPLGAPAAVSPPRAATPVLAPVVLHAAVDPFRPLVTASGELRSQQPLHRGQKLRTSLPAGPTATTAHRPAGTTAPSGPRCQRSVVVQPGQSLWSIAQDHHLGATTVNQTGHPSAAGPDWQSLYAANHHAVGPNPDVLAVGTRLCLPI